jgi:ankyrin repeat protein
MEELVDAIMRLDSETVNRLLQSGARVNVVDGGHTPLQWASSVGNVDAVRTLLRHGADPNLVDNAHAMTALHFAAGASADLVDLLCSAGARTNERNDVGMTPVMVAAKSGSLDIVTRLIKYGAILNTYDASLRGPLHWSAIGGDYPELNSYLIEAGADPRAATAYGKTYLDILETLRLRRTPS